MSSVTDAISEHVRKGIAAQDAADRLAGRMTVAELDHEAVIGELRGRLGEELAAAIAAARRAARALTELAGPVYDVEYAESERGDDVAALIESARRGLAAAQALLIR
ncbi:MAG: methyltransferase type 11 [Mycobacterium sp.]|nr:methyltransferase type 11 [Mycobacterium sp.]